MKKGIDILVGTPGRILDHVKRGNLNLAVGLLTVALKVSKCISANTAQSCFPSKT